MRLANVLTALLDPNVADVRFTAYDGSSSGSPDAPVQVEIRSPEAISYLVRSPGELGLARAYVGGHLGVVGDMHTALDRLSALSIRSLGWSDRAGALRLLGPHAVRRLRPPPEEVRLQGRRHSKRRDAAAIAHHYDVSNAFYEIVLGPSMAYTCAVYPHEGASLEEAQAEKFDLVARKLALRPGMRLLDVGCGWGGMVMHAARHYGVQALGVTLSRQQAEWAAKAIAEEGLTEQAEVRHLDYRDVEEGEFDAISSIGLTEHIGRAQLPSYFRFLLSKLRPQGRLLNHCIMRSTNVEPAIHRRGFINRYVFPDGELSGLGHIVSVMQDNGFEVKHEENLREHYARTLAAWCANLDDDWDRACAEVGERTARVWRLYMAGSRLAFERNRIQLHQVLAVRPDDAGASGYPLRPDWVTAQPAADAAPGLSWRPPAAVQPDCGVR